MQYQVVYGFLNNCSENKEKYKKNILIILSIAILVSQVSFTVFVKYLYPSLGIIGILEIQLILLAILKK